MKINILGFWGGYPKDGGATSGYLISTAEGKLLLDCGSGVMSKLSMHTTIEHISGVVLSHLHHDHAADIGILQYAMVGALRLNKKAKKMLVYAPNEPSSALQCMQSDQTDFIAISDKTVSMVAGIKIEYCHVSHTIPCYAVKLTYKGKVVVYSADTAYDEVLIDFAKDADLFICEATICEGSYHTAGAGHMDAAEAGRIAKLAQVKKLVLTHLPHDGNFDLMKREAMRSFGKEAYLASEQAEYELD